MLKGGKRKIQHVVISYYIIDGQMDLLLPIHTKKFQVLFKEEFSEAPKILIILIMSFKEELFR